MQIKACEYSDVSIYESMQLLIRLKESQIGLMNSALALQELFRIMGPCDNVSVASLVGVPGFANLNIVNVCSAPDTLALLIYNDGSVPLTNVSLEIDFDPGLSYGGFSYSKEPGATVTPSNVSDPTRPIFAVSNILPNEVVVAYIAVKANCDIDVTGPIISLDATVQFTSGSQLCSKTIANVGEYNSAIKIPVLNMLSVTPPERIITNSTSTFCQDIVISQDGLQSKLESYTFIIDSVDLTGLLSLTSLTANGIALPYTYDATTQQVIATVGPSFFTANTGTGANNNMFFDVNERMTIRACYRSNGCLPGTEFLHYRAYYGCDDKICFDVTSKDASLRFQPNYGANAVAVTNTVDYGGICGDNLVYTVTLNSQNANRQDGLWTDLILKYKGCILSNTSVLSLSINGATLPSSLWSISGETIIFNFTNNTSDFDGPGGLEDFDGDGFFDDLPGGNALQIRTELAIGCSVEGDCRALSCTIHNFEVNGKRNCGQAFQQFATLSQPISYLYGEDGFSTNVQNIPGYGIPITEVMQTTANTWLPTVNGYDFSYNFNSENIDPCPGSGSVYFVVNVNARRSDYPNIRYRAGSATYQGMSVSAVTDTYLTAPNPSGNGIDTVGYEIIILAGDPSANLNDYYFDLEYRGYCAPFDYVYLSYQIVEECTGCSGGPNPCRIVRSCRNASTYVAWRGINCLCKVTTSFDRIERKNYGYTDKSMTTKVDRASVPDIDKRRFLPGDTMVYSAVYTILDTAILRQSNQQWQMYIYNWDRESECRLDMSQATFKGWFLKRAATGEKIEIGIPSCMQNYPDIVRDNFYYPSMWFRNFGVDGLSTSFVDANNNFYRTCLNDPNINPNYPPSSAVNYWQGDLSTTDIVSDQAIMYLYWNRPPQCPQTGAPSQGGSSNDHINTCLEEFLAQWNIQPGDAFVIDVEAPMMRNPNVKLAQLNGVTPLKASRLQALWRSFATEPTSCSSSLVASECGQTGPFETHAPGPVETTIDVEVTDCEVKVNYNFRLENPVPIVSSGITPWYQNEYRPYMAVDYLEPFFPPNLVYGNDGMIVLYDGTEIPIPASSIDPSYGNLSCVPDGSGGICCNAEDPNQEAALRINDNDFYVGINTPYYRGPASSSNTNNPCNVNPLVHMHNDPFPFLSVGGTNDCTWGVKLNLLPICPEELESTQFGLRAQFSDPYVPSLPGVEGMHNGAYLINGQPNPNSYLFSYTINPYGTNCTVGEGCTRYYEQIVPNPIVSTEANNPMRQTDTLQTTPDNFIDNALDLPALASTVQRLRIADEAGVNEENIYTVCANALGSATHQNVVTTIFVPSSIELINVLDENDSPLTFTLSQALPKGSTYYVSMPDISASQCVDLKVITELLFCPVGFNVSTEICLRTSSGCLSPDKLAIITSNFNGCVAAGACYNYIAEEADIQVEWDPFPTGEYSLCDEIDMGVRIKNVKPALLIDILTNFWLPDGLEFIPGSWQACYPGGAGFSAPPYSIPDPTADPSKNNFRGTYYGYTSDQLWSNAIFQNGLPGIAAGLDSNQVTLKFRVRTICDEFVSGTSPWFQADAADPCEQRVLSQIVQANPINITNANPINFAQFFVLADPLDFNCGVVDTLELTYLNISPLGVSNNTNVCIKLDPGAFNYLPGSSFFISPSNYTTTLTEDFQGNVVEVCFTVPDGIGPGQAFKIGMALQMSETIDCGEGDLGVEVSSIVFDQGCAAEGTQCNVNVLNSVNPSVTVNFLPPLQTQEHSLTKDCDSNPANTTLRYKVKLNNPGTNYAANVRMALIRDLNGNGLVDDFDPEIATFTEFVTLPMGDMAELEGTFTIANGIACPVFLCVMQETNCVCDNQEFLYTSIEPSFSADLENRVVLCPNVPLALEVCSDFDVELVPAEGGTLTYADGGDSLYVNLNPGFGISSPVRMRVTSQVGGCDPATFETEIFRLSDFELGPYELQTLCTDNCKRLDLLIPSQYRNSVEVEWVPSTFLDDPTSIRPILCNPTQNLTYTVNVTFVDGDQTCLFTAQYPIRAVDLQLQVLSNTIVCVDEGTPAKITDNKLRFSLLVTGGTGNYNVIVNGGTTITPTSGTFGTATTFLLGPGTGGGGSTFMITITDPTATECPKTISVTDLQNCTPVTPIDNCPPVKCGTATIQVNGN